MIRKTGFRTAAAILGVAFLASAANAAEIKVSTFDKSPTEVRAAVADAAFKVCKQAYAGDNFAIYEIDSCVRDAAEAALVKADAGAATALNTSRQGAVLASR